MPPVVINVDGISRAAKQYDPKLKTLPFDTLEPVLMGMGINLLEVGEGDNIETTFERKGGIISPYKAATVDQDASESALGKFVEMPLTTKKVKAAIKDHIDNYTSDVVVVGGPNKVDDQSKKHPLEYLIIQNQVLTIAEDQIDAMFHSKFDTDDQSPLGISDGFYTLQDNFVISGDIAEAKGNYRASGSLAAPDPDDEDDFTAYKNLLAWVRAAHPHLRKQNANLFLPSSIKLAACDAAANKFKRLNDVNTSILQALLREHADFPNLNIISHSCLGSGDRIFIAPVGGLDYGMNMKSSAQYVQVRSPYKDPNWVQFWAQFRVGQRIKSLHPKMFLMNEGTTTAVSLAGDYS